MKRHLWILLAGFVLASPGSGLGDDLNYEKETAWHEFRSAEAGYVALFPRKPAEGTMTFQTREKVKLKVQTADAPNGTRFMVLYGELPIPEVKELDSEKFLKFIAEAMMKPTAVKLIHEASVRGT